MIHRKPVVKRKAPVNQKNLGRTMPEQERRPIWQARAKLREYSVRRCESLEPKGEGSCTTTK